MVLVLEVAVVDWRAAHTHTAHFTLHTAHSDTADNKKSPVAGKNDMGGSASNIASGSSEEKGRPAPTSKEDSAGNRNTPGGMSAKKGMKNEPGHGAEKKSKPETADNKKPIIGG